jgi:hypothetical protein
MIYGETNGIPKLRGNLPFIQKTGLCTLKKPTWLEIGNLQISFERILISHVKDALGKLLRSRRLATPLWTFNQNSTLAGQFIGQHGIRYSPPIILHNAKLYHFTNQNTIRSAFWRNSVRRFGIFHNLSATPKPSLRTIRPNLA